MIILKLLKRNWRSFQSLPRDVNLEKDPRAHHSHESVRNLLDRLTSSEKTLEFRVDDLARASGKFLHCVGSQSCSTQQSTRTVFAISICALESHYVA